MDLTQDDLAAIVGNLMLENAALRKALQSITQPQPERPPPPAERRDSWATPTP